MTKLDGESLIAEIQESAPTVYKIARQAKNTTQACQMTGAFIIGQIRAKLEEGDQMNVSEMQPKQVVLDLVLKYSTTMGVLGTALVVPDGALMITTLNHRGEYVQMSCPIHFDGKASTEPPRWVLFRLGPSVWKLAPSILDEKIHAYVTVVNVPEPAPWLSHPLYRGPKEADL